MKRYRNICWYSALLGLFCVLGIGSISATALDKDQFSKDRKVLLQRIKTINQILQQTTSKKALNTGQLTAINKKIESNEQLIGSLSKELQVVNAQMAQKEHKIQTLQAELIQLEEEYAKILFWGSKSMQHINVLVFIFSADTFQVLLQKLSITKEYVKLRKQHFAQIKKTELQLQHEKKHLTNKAKRKGLLLHRRQCEQTGLQESKTQQQELIGVLEQQQGQLTKELHQHNAAVKRLDKLISDIVKKELALAAAAKKAAATAQDSNKPANRAAQAISAAGKLLSTRFAKHKGKLPWPVKKGFISNKFGRRAHAVFKNVQVENLGIDIQTEAQATVHAIFDGFIKTVSFVPGMNYVVIIQHGQYHTVYAKLSAVHVKVGQVVHMKDFIGIVSTDNNHISELQLQIWNGLEKLNPALWLTKEPE